MLIYTYILNEENSLFCQLSIASRGGDIER